MSVSYYQSALVQLQKTAATLHSDLAKQEDVAAKARSAGASKRHQAAQTKNVSSAKSYVSQAESEDKKLVAAETKIAEIRAKLASNADQQNQKNGSLAQARKSEQAAADRKEEQRRREEEQRQRKEKSDRATRDREDDRRRQKEREHARDVARLSTVTVRHVLERPVEPEKLRVLYLTSNPEETSSLRVDAEVNNVMKALRGVKHRDLIELAYRPAATPQDLVDGINDLRPHVVHFSGHGGPHGVLFDNASFDAPKGQVVGFGPLARLLAATRFPPTLVVLNACETVVAAELLLEAVPVVIAMSEPVGDMSAGIFATHFYAAIGGAQSIGHAVDQARAMIAMTLPDEPDLATICAAPGVDPLAMVLIEPS